MEITIFHFLTIAFFIILGGGIAYLIYLYMPKEGIVTYTVAEFFVFILLIAALFQVEKMTKIGELEAMQTSRVYANEKMIISGRLANKGISNFKECSLHVVVKENAINTDLSRLKNELFSEKETFLDSIVNLFKEKKEKKNTRIEETFTIGQHLSSGSYESFSVSIPLPAEYSEPKLDYDLTCH